MNTDWLRRLPHRAKRRYDKRIREAAIKQVERDLRLHSKSRGDISPDDYEYLVADAETKVKNRIKNTIGAGLLIFLGGS